MEVQVMIQLGERKEELREGFISLKKGRLQSYLQNERKETLEREKWKMP